MTDKKLRNKLTQLVGQYDDPQDLFKDSVDEFMLMYGLRHNQPELIEYMLKTLNMHQVMKRLLILLRNF